MKNNINLKILIAEDDYMVAREIRFLLEKIGYSNIEEAGDGDDAVQKAKALSPDLILMDIKMPKMDGIEASRIIQKNSPAPVVVISAHESPEMLELANEAGISAYLTKPIEEAELDRAITIAVARHRDLKEIRRLNRELEERNDELYKALEEIKTLRGILPMCSFCNKIRDEKGEWVRVDAYIYRHSEAKISHGLCPDCLKKHYPDFEDDE